MNGAEGLPRDLVCPACFKLVASDRTVCGACGEGVWVGDKLVLVGALQDGVTSAYRGLLRGDDGKLEDVAVKLLDVGGLPNWREYERFGRQTSILGSLKHPRIPRARGDFELKGRVFHCQTRVSGRTLARQFRGARLSSDEATRLAEELLEILAYLHEHDVVHRDVKPDNVIVDDKGAANLVDFGAARRLHGPGDTAGVDRKMEPEPTVVGTPGYMAPEQARGDVTAQSDLYALGKLLLEGLGGAKPEGALAVLLPQLVREDWRKRPASAAAALQMLRPAPRAKRAAWPVVAIASMAVVGIVIGVRHARRAPPAIAAVATEAAVAAAPDGPSLEDQARALLMDWLVAQNARDLERYRRVYAEGFRGVRRTPTGKTVTLDRTAWLTERARMYSKPVEVKADDVNVTTDAAAGVATVTFTQRFRRGTFADHGTKQLAGKRTGATMQWISEEMLFSRPGWDDDSYATQVPLVAADCRVAFDPGAGSHLVALSRHDDYIDALAAAAKARKKKIGVEIVFGDDLKGLESGYWVLAGATDDADKAAALAAKLGGEVHDASLAEQKSYGIVRLIARKPLNLLGLWNHRYFTVLDGSAVFIGNHYSVQSIPLLGDDLVPKSDLSLPSGVKPVRLASYRGAAHVLDEEGHWYRIGKETVDRAPSFDPDGEEGKVAAFPAAHFAFEGGANLFARLPNADPLPWPIDDADVAIFKASDNRLAVVRAMELFVFEIGRQPNRLTKVCVSVDPGPAHKLEAPVQIGFGALSLTTDRSGHADVWTGDWGFIEPKIAPAGEKSVVTCGEDEDEMLEAPMLPLFRQTSVTLPATASCEVVGC